jgi:hypothetical protein
LERLREHEPETAHLMIAKLTGVAADEIGQDQLEIGIQKRADGGEFFDLCLETGAWKAVVEVKVKSPVDIDQLKRYRERLNNDGSKAGKLSLLTRDRIPGNAEPLIDANTRWSGLGRDLARAMSDMRDHATKYVVAEFLAFLTAKGMAMTKVEKELGPGLQSMTTLMTLLRDGLLAEGISRARPSMSLFEGEGGERGWSGFWFAVDKASCWCGLYLTSPEKLVFGVGTPNTTLKRLSELDLSSAGGHFFSLTDEEQRDRIYQYLTESIRYVRTANSAVTPPA